MGDDGGEYEVQELDPRVMLVPEFLPGERVTITIGSSTKQAEVRFVGPLQGMKGFFLGVQYDDKVGKNDGQHNGRRYFRCPPNHGGFVRATKVTRSETGEPAAVPSLEEHAVDSSTERATSESPGAGGTGTYATGPGLHKAVVGSLSQFTIVAVDADGQRRDKGGDEVAVVIRGRSAGDHSQPALLRTKLIDRGDGTYMCEYRPWLTGSFAVSVTLDQQHINGSPYELTIITLRPDASRCVVRGDALSKAVARIPMKVS